MARAARPLSAAAFVAALVFAGCARSSAAGDEIIRFWGMGREGEVVRDLVPEFERRNPGIRVIVQQMPWTAAHEKLLTGFVGQASPDLAQMGNTWIPEFAAIGALEPIDARIAGSRALSPGGYFEGIWKTNVFDGRTYGVPWYVDTRVLFYRRDLLSAAGYSEAPRTWATWREAMRKIRGASSGERYAILLPTDEWHQAVIFGVEKGSTLLAEGDTRGAFAQPAFSAATDFYIGLFHDGLAPAVSNTQLGNPYQEFARGYVAMWITGPWNLGEFRRRLPPDFQDKWMTAPMPAPDAASGWPGLSLAGGSSIALFRGSKHADAAWKFLEFLSDPAVQNRFYALSGDLPARTASWEDPSLKGDAKAAAFRAQLERVAPMPRVPEWEQIAQKLAEDLEPAIRGRESVRAALGLLDGNVDRILEKRRWLLSRAKGRRGR